ncbi:MAG: adenosylcobalamin-dependent ribonucleoside-diphosphate reductase [Planctomycetota bacterium]|jgi:ribonucleoside-diphosphate reductase alpha chain
MPGVIVKRDGSSQPFDREKITRAVLGALTETGAGGREIAERVSADVVKTLEERKIDRPSVEQVQDLVEEALIHAGLERVARAYIVYREHHAEERRAKALFGVQDDLKLSLNAIKVLERRYLRKDEAGEVVETPREMFRRVAKAVAAADGNYGSTAEAEEKFYRLMTSLEFLPNSPTLMNAGTSLGQLAACFVIPVGDSIIEIFDALKDMAIIHQSGGGTGFSFSRLRPNGDVVRSTGGVASGPVSFMHIFDAATDVIKQGGRRRGANMGALRVDHPDILEFISAKSDGSLKNFNISVAVTDSFLGALENGEDYDLVNPRNGEATGKLSAADVFDLAASNAWMTGDPGLIFIDEINRHNPTPAAGTFEGTNPCGEQPLLEYESCNLGSINVSQFVADGDFDRERLGEAIEGAVHFLDNVIDVCRYPLPAIEKMTRANRKIGLGVMGLAEALILLGVPYDSEEALAVGEGLMKFVSERARAASAALAEKRGSFPNFEKSVWPSRGFKRLRNATVTTIAPTGTISIIAGCSSGIEPLFAVSYFRSIMEGTLLLEENGHFRRIALERGFYSRDLLAEIASTGSALEVKGVPEDVRRLFVTAHDIAPEWHLKMQAAFQKHTDNAVSKTVNLPRTASVSDVKKVFRAAIDLKLKGITVYRYGSHREQPLSFVGGENLGPTGRVVGSEWSGGCETCG